MPVGATFFDQTVFPYVDGYPANYKNLPDDMNRVVWSALVHSPWDRAQEIPKLVERDEDHIDGGHLSGFSGEDCFYLVVFDFNRDRKCVQVVDGKEIFMVRV